MLTDRCAFDEFRHLQRLSTLNKHRNFNVNSTSTLFTLKNVVKAITNAEVYSYATPFRRPVTSNKRRLGQFS